MSESKHVSATTVDLLSLLRVLRPLCCPNLPLSFLVPGLAWSFRGRKGAVAKEGAASVTEAGATDNAAATSEPCGPSQLTRTIQLHGSESTLAAVIDSHFSSQRSSDVRNGRSSSRCCAAGAVTGSNAGAGAKASTTGDAQPCVGSPSFGGGESCVAGSWGDRGGCERERGDGGKGKAAVTHGRKVALGDGEEPSYSTGESEALDEVKGQGRGASGGAGDRSQEGADLAGSAAELLSESPPVDRTDEEKREGRRIVSSAGMDARAAPQEGVVLVGLHACGDLTVAALRAFVRCGSVASLAIMGCCYNRLTERGAAEAVGGRSDVHSGRQHGRRGIGEAGTEVVMHERLASAHQEAPGMPRHAPCHPTAADSSIEGRGSSGPAPHDGAPRGLGEGGFPVSLHLQRHGLALGHSGRDLACQSAHKWKVKRVEEARGEFEAHAFRAALQVILGRRGEGGNDGDGAQLGEVELGKNACKDSSAEGRRAAELWGQECRQNDGSTEQRSDTQCSAAGVKHGDVGGREISAAEASSAVWSNAESISGEESGVCSEGYHGVGDRGEGSAAVTSSRKAAAVGGTAVAAGAVGGAAVVRVGRLGKARRRRQRMAQVMELIEGCGGSAYALVKTQGGGVGQSAAGLREDDSGVVSATVCEGPLEPSRISGSILATHVSSSHTTLANDGDVAEIDESPGPCDMAASGVNSMEAQTRSFHHYCQQALQRMNDQAEIPFSEAAAVWREVQPHARAIAAVWVLRAVLAGPLEALIVIDRLLMMEESGGTFKPRGVMTSQMEAESDGRCRHLFEFDVIPLFDPVISPRNMVIVANKC